MKHLLRILAIVFILSACQENVVEPEGLGEENDSFDRQEDETKYIGSIELDVEEGGPNLAFDPTPLDDFDEEGSQGISFDPTSVDDIEDDEIEEAK